MPRYQATKPIYITGTEYGHQIEKGLKLVPGDIVDYDTPRKVYFFDGVLVRADLTILINNGTLVSIGLSPLFDFADIGSITAADIPFTPTGSISATNVQDAIEETYAESLQPEFVNEQLLVQTNGQTVFLLSQTPLSNNSVSLFVNGAVYVPGFHFTVSGDILTWLNIDFSLQTTDQVIAGYLIDIA